MFMGKVAVRHDKRITNRVLALVLEGEHRVVADDWSMGGVAFSIGEDEIEAFKKGQQINGCLGEHDDMALHFTAQVVRVDPVNGRVALQFVELGVGIFDYMEAAIMGPLHRERIAQAKLLGQQTLLVA